MAKVTFQNTNPVFFRTLKASVETYFRESGLEKTGNWRLYHKALIVVPLAIAIYVVLLSNVLAALPALLLCGVLGLCLAAIGFNIMHDACHGSYSSKKWVNNLLGLSLNAIGGNAFFWKQKHNVLHHTYTNIEGVDDDIAQSKLLRQSPTQEWKPIHQYQHIYVTFAYMLTLPMWILVRDFDKYFNRRIHNTPLQPMDRSEHITFWVTKATYIFFYIALPIILLGPLPWLAGWATMNIVCGVVISYVFQLAHAVEGPEFDAAGIDDKMIENEWAVHQIRTTANFAPRNRWISWFVGGLNFQIEHHLFPRISHVHYPKLSPIVEAHCKEFGLPYHCFPTIGSAIASHLRTMKELGQKPEGVNSTPVPA